MSEVALRVPDLATNTSSVIITRWLVGTGENVRRGQPIVEVETDKSVMEIESIVTGTLRSITIAAGEQANTGDVIALIETLEAVSTIPSRPPTAPTLVPTNVDPPRAADPTRMSFFARNRRTRSALSLRKTPLGVARRALARRTLASKQSIPHFYLQASANAQSVVDRRAAGPNPKIVWDAFFVLACARALIHYPKMSHRFEDDHLIAPDQESVNVAVDLDGDLFTLFIDRPSAKSLEQVSDEIRAGVERIRQGDRLARDPRPANLTISNLGGANVESFIAIINPPEAAILAVGKIGLAPAVVDGRLAVQTRVALSLSVDHRVVSGKYAARFLDAVITELEGDWISA
jgi:pyruvate dehydrogenase E2 component (dihydrolipoamide acetyltransferase)